MRRSNISAVNMGPRYSSDGAVQYVIRKGVNKIVFDQSNVPGTGYIKAGPIAIAKAAKVPIVTFEDTVPIQDANSVALKLVQAAGRNGGVVLNFTPDQALLILQAAQQQGIADDVRAWGCSTPCNSDFVAAALGSVWDGKFGVNAELNLTSAPGPDSKLYREVAKSAKLAFGLGSFSQMGFVEARIADGSPAQHEAAVHPAEGERRVRGRVTTSTRTSSAARGTSGRSRGTSRTTSTGTTTPKNGKMVIEEGCFKISAADPDIAKVRAAREAEPEADQGQAVPASGLRD